jgi:hypothetical protein
VPESSGIQEILTEEISGGTKPNGASESEKDSLSEIRRRIELAAQKYVQESSPAKESSSAPESP